MKQASVLALLLLLGGCRYTLDTEAFARASSQHPEANYECGADAQATLSVNPDTGNLILSVSGDRTFDGVAFQGGDLIEWDGTTATLFFDEADGFGAAGSGEGFVGNEDIDAVYVLGDGEIVLSTTGGAENPTLTIVTLAIRQADHIAQEMSSGNI